MPLIGNSGGPILKDKKVLGMILFGDNDCTALKSDYILQIINGLG